LIREADKLYHDYLCTLQKFGASLSCIQNVRKDTMANKTLSHDSIADKLMTKASRIRAKKRADAFLKRMTLDQLRKDRKMTQGKLALAMNTQQAKFPVSKNAPKSNSEHYAVPLADTSRFAPSSQTRTLNSRSPNSVAPSTDAKHVHP